MLAEIVITNSEDYRNLIVKVRGEAEKECKEVLETLLKAFSEGKEEKIFWRRSMEVHEVKNFDSDQVFYDGSMRFSVPKEGK